MEVKMWYGINTEKKTERELYLESELERYREEEERLREERYRERKECEAAREIEREERLHWADNWPDALRKQVVLCRREASYDDVEDIDQFFSSTADACERALELWKAVAGKLQPEIDELEARIAAIRNEIPSHVANLLEEEMKIDAWKHVVDALRSGDRRDFLDW
jgi:predicted  nucleic acid-binding Zn-ribbon protein